ncbi:unnamed protein product, partial [Prorocentrum cordatum]
GSRTVLCPARHPPAALPAAATAAALPRWCLSCAAPGEGLGSKQVPAPRFFAMRASRHSGRRLAKAEAGNAGGRGIGAGSPVGRWPAGPAEGGEKGRCRRGGGGGGGEGGRAPASAAEPLALAPERLEAAASHWGRRARGAAHSARSGREAAAASGRPRRRARRGGAREGDCQPGTN